VQIDSTGSKISEEILILFGAKRAICITVPDCGAIPAALLMVQDIELQIEVSTLQMISIKLLDGGKLTYVFLRAPGLGATGKIDFFNLTGEVRLHWRWSGCVHCRDVCAERLCREGERVM